jgi:hypothetical protein
VQVFEDGHCVQFYPARDSGFWAPAVSWERSRREERTVRTT